jgi:hypothetical protein
MRNWYLRKLGDEASNMQDDSHNMRAKISFINHDPKNPVFVRVHCKARDETRKLA